MLFTGNRFTYQKYYKNNWFNYSKYDFSLTKTTFDIGGVCLSDIHNCIRSSTIMFVRKDQNLKRTIKIGEICML